MGGSAIEMGLEVSRNVKKLKKHRLDPHSPNLEQRDRNLADMFRLFMGPFYNACPNENKEEYMDYIRGAIRLAEVICIIETQLINGEIPQPSSKEHVEARVYQEYCMEYLKFTKHYFDKQTMFLNEVSDTIYLISTQLIDHLMNIKTLIKNFETDQ